MSTGNVMTLLGRNLICRAISATASACSNAAWSSVQNDFAAEARSSNGIRRHIRAGRISSEDDILRQVYCNLLQALAGNGREGMDKLASTPVDMVITDWNMPEMSGIDFIKAVRTNAATKALPVLMVTTNAAEDDIKEALRAGVNNYVVKPFTPDTIKEKIQSAIKA